MKTNYLTLLLCGMVVVAGLSACSQHRSKDDQTIGVGADDAEMNAAIAQARSLLPDFWQHFESPKPDESDFALKVRIADGEKVEHFWVIDIERKDGKISGTINNEPDIVQNVKIGQRITINEADISDWLYMRHGKMVGNYTLRILFKQMSAEEVTKLKALLADP